MCRILEAVAYAELEWQAYRLREIQRAISQATNVERAGTRLAWDGASELVNLHAIAEKTNASQRGSSWQVCVCQVTFCWGSSKSA